MENDDNRSAVFINENRTATITTGESDYHNPDSRSLMEQMKKMEMSIIHEILQMQANLISNSSHTSVDLDSLGFPMRKIYHVQTLCDNLRINDKYSEIFSNAIVTFVQQLGRTTKDREVCSAVYERLMTEDLRLNSNASGR
jgi:hypothetical protein